MNATRSTEDRLSDCFASVFPDVPVGNLRMASAESTPGWDSIALVTLIAATEEEFETALPTEAYPDLTSFQAFLRQLEGIQ